MNQLYYRQIRNTNNSWHFGTRGLGKEDLYQGFGMELAHYEVFHVDPQEVGPEHAVNDIREYGGEVFT